jgi:hypothetical protein
VSRRKASIEWVVIFFGLILGGCGVQTAKSQLQFSAGEHVILGDLGYQKSCLGRSNCPAKIARADGRLAFSYGELVAFGDFYESANDLYREQDKPWFDVFRNDVNGTRQLFQREVTAVQNMMDGHGDESYPDLDNQYAFNYPQYVVAAERNFSHFGFYNMVRYVKEHTRALVLAQQVYRARAARSDQAEVLLSEALVQSGFADHFLTDGFASGHIRNPRQQTLAWAREHKLRDQTAAMLSRVLHDRDGEVRDSGEHGLPVMNARGDEWFARCDAQLFYHNDLEAPAVALASEAVAVSVDEVLTAIERGEQPVGVYRATQLVPFPALTTPSLTATFAPARLNANKAFERLAWYFRLPLVSEMSPQLISNFVQDLPAVMASLRSDIADQLIHDRDILERLPAAYVAAYMAVD